MWLPYSAGFLGLFITTSSLMSVLVFRYDPGVTSQSELSMLVPSTLVGIAIFIGRIVGAVVQPIIGHLSDNCKSPWGQRRPFLAAGTFPMVIALMLIFNPIQSIPATWNFFCLTFLLCLFFCGFSTYQVSYLAWIPTLAKTSQKVVLLSTYIATASLVGTLIGGVSAPWLTQQYGFSTMASVLCSMSLCTLLMPLAVAERAKRQGQGKARPTLWQSLKEGWTNPAFRYYIVGISSAWIAVSIIGTSSAFLAIAVLNRDVSYTAVVNALSMLGAISGFALITPLSKKFGKKKAFQLSMVWCGFSLVLLVILSVWFNAPFAALLALFLVSSVGLAGFFILPNAMLADIIHHARLKTGGAKRDATYFGSRGLIVEVSVGAGALASGVLLSFGKTAAQPLGVHLAIGAAGFFTLLAAGAFARYPLPD